MVIKMISNFAYLLIFLGLFLIFTSVIGCYRFPDYFSKMHAATIGDAVGCPLSLVGIALLSNNWKIAFLVPILLVINPTASYILNRVALKKGLPLEYKDK
jgi:multicomponent Na+:H+ antiporter subunit G